MEESEIKIINLTPHKVRLMDKDGNVLVVFPSEGTVRLEERRQKIKTIQYSFIEQPIDMTEHEDPIHKKINIDIYKKTFGGSNLPQRQKGTYYIVSLPVAQAFPERDDFLVPDQLVRDEEGQVIGARSFSIFKTK